MARPPDIEKARKRLLGAMRSIARRKMGALTEEEAMSLGEESFGREMKWGDVVVSSVGGKVYASAFLRPEKGMAETLPLLSDLGFAFDYIEAPSRARFAELKMGFLRRREKARKAVAAARKAGDERAAKRGAEELEKAEKGLLKVEVAERMASQPGCIDRYILTTAQGATREEAIARVREQARKILFRAGGLMLREGEIKRCFTWEEATGESIERASEGRGMGSLIARQLKRIFG